MPSWDNKPKGHMLAAVLTAPGKQSPSQCFTIDAKYPKPTLPSEDWILVQVKVAGLNRAELRGRMGEAPGLGELNIFQEEYHEDPPKILGEEFVGVVSQPGNNTDFKENERVTGFIYGGGKAHDGSYAEYVICHKRRLYNLPRTSLSWSILGAIPMSMWTAWGSIFESGQLQAKQTLLVHGATSSVGIWACLLAKDAGCTVIATTRQASKVERLTATGADHVFLEDDLHDKLAEHFPRGVDVILELVGPDKLMSFTFKHLARHGTAVCTGVLSKAWAMEGFVPASIPPTRKLTFYGMTNRGSAGDEDEGLEKVEHVLEEVIRKVESGIFKQDVFLDRTFSLQEVGAAHQYMEDNKAVGKVVLTVQ